MIVYIDIIFFVNVIIDALLLWTTAWTRKATFAWWRLGVSSAVGGLYVVLLFFPALSFLYTFIVKFLLSLLMIWIAFGYGGLQLFWRNVGAFYVVNFVAAGTVLGVEYASESSGDIVAGIQAGFELKVSLLLLLFALPLFYWLYRKVTENAKRKERLTTFTAQVEVHIGDVASCCTGLIDTGNQLYDPLTRTPVMVMEAAQWERHIPAGWMQKIRRAEVEQLVMGIGASEDEAPFIWQDRLRLVPYRGVNRGTQWMLAIKPDRVVITTEAERYESPKVLIGLDGGCLSLEKTYQAIIHPALLQP